MRRKPVIIPTFLILLFFSIETGYGEPNRTKKSLKKVIPASSATLKKIPAHTASAIQSAVSGDSNPVKKVKNVVMEFSPENPFLRKRHRRRNKKLLRT